MAKRIKIDEACLEEIRAAFEEKLKGLKCSDGKFKFEKSLSNVKAKAKMVFEEDTWNKMKALIASNDKEVGWHCLVNKATEEGFDGPVYNVYDIMVYPQEVTGATVNTNKPEFEKWLYDFDADVFNHIRCHGHSHVNMGTSPSSVDKTMYEEWMDDLVDGMENQFYIFMIWNKKGERWINIYDLNDNLLYENGDVDVEYIQTAGGIEDFLEKSAEMVKTKVYTTQPTNKGSVTYIGMDGKPESKSSYTAPAYSTPYYDDDDDWDARYYGTNYYKGYSRW